MTLEDAIKLANEKRDDFKQFTHWEEYEHAFVFSIPGNCADGGFTAPFIIWKDGLIDYSYAEAMFDDTLGDDVAEGKLN